MNVRDDRFVGVTRFLLLDFDGVVNQTPLDFVDSSVFEANADLFLPDGSFSARPSPLGPGAYPPPEYPVTFSTELIAQLNNLLSRDDMQLVWVSTWGDSLRGVSKTLGIQAARKPIVLNYPRKMADYDSLWGKPTGVAGFTRGIAPDVKVAWADDVVVPYVLRTNSVPVRSVDDEFTLFLSPNPDFGLSRSDVQLLKEFFDDK